MTASRLIIWRHGRTEWNAKRLFQGQTDVGLDDLGRRQAAAAAAVLATLGVDRIVASDLSRARDTAQALAERTGLPVTTDPRLREIDVGSWAGMSVEQMAEQNPWYATAYETGADFRRSETGETTTEVAHRAAAGIGDAAAGAPDGSTVVVAMHGLAGRLGICAFLGLPYDTWNTFAGMHNCGWAVLRRRGGSDRWRLDTYNQTAPVD